MKKIIYTIAILASSQAVFAQGFLNRLKDKVSTAVEKKAEPAASTASVTPSGNPKYTDPAQFGTLIMTFSKDAINSHQGTFALWFQSVNVINNQLTAQIVDYDEIYNYSGGQLTKTGAKTKVQLYTVNNRSEYYLQSKNFSQHDMENSMLKKGPHVGSGMQPGKATQTMTFNGKSLGDYFMFQLAHNADSTAIVVAGTVMNKGVSYQMSTSAGQITTLPKTTLPMPILSPDGKMAAAIVFSQTAGGADIYVSNGTKTAVPNWDSNQGVWIRNSGAVYCVSNDGKKLLKNGEVFHSSTSPILTKEIFIGNNDKGLCWVGDHTLCFSDGTVFENGSSPMRVTLDGKEMVVFLAINVTTGKLYLCKHEL